MDENEIIKKIANIVERVRPSYLEFKGCRECAEAHQSNHIEEECNRAEELFDEFAEEYPDYEMLCRFAEECPDLYLKAIKESDY